MRQVFWRLQAAVFYCLTLAGALIPSTLFKRCGGMVGHVLWRLLPSRRAVVIDNLRQALPYLKGHPLWQNSNGEAGAIALENYGNLGKSLIEICQLYHGRGDHLIAALEVRGLEHYEKARAKGKGIICFSGHCGNWELMALAFSRLFGDGVVVARRQNNPFFNQMVERMRMSYRSRVIYKKGAFRGILSALRSGELVGILADQAAGPEDGVLVSMLGRRAWATKAPVLIARKSGAPLLPVFIHREGESHVITFHPEHRFSGDMSDHGIQKETQALSRYVEDFVAAHPTQWYWMHRRWKRAGEASA
ncbi:lysophospholipid acyltransferase family protein [Geomonas azotofigens]|uniref:lysophospholipid acyltransferase family protein n=1 Tax=Geomonas azotofigens TaxID=2843196 RepID=UPI001C11445D|nr:lysophospholipid acyltransferase family protein [Geomonas azotofigens]MBU5612829.1 lysophospholipid acyltransferase family protein [Geomonas azotofigens]